MLEGLVGKEWFLVRELNQNLKAQIKTKYGLTRPIAIKDSIRQGGVLSVLQYATLMDEIAKAIQAEDLGVQVKNQNAINASFETC